jgi:hypothetical protein
MDPVETREIKKKKCYCSRSSRISHFGEDPMDVHAIVVFELQNIPTAVSLFGSRNVVDQQ